MMAFGSASSFDSLELIKYIMADRIRKMTPIRSMKGIRRICSASRNFRIKANGSVKMATQNVAFAVAFFQNKPNRKMQKY